MAEQPNILLILTDQQRLSTLACYGGLQDKGIFHFDEIQFTVSMDEMLFDMDTDPHEMNNLAADPHARHDAENFINLWTKPEIDSNGTRTNF